MTSTKPATRQTWQRAAVRGVAARRVTVLTGGPGMGKTHAIGQILRTMLHGSGGGLRIGLAPLSTSFAETLAGMIAVREAVVAETA